MAAFSSKRLCKTPLNGTWRSAITWTVPDDGVLIVEDGSDTSLLNVKPGIAGTTTVCARAVGLLAEIEITVP